MYFPSDFNLQNVPCPGLDPLNVQAPTTVGFQYWALAAFYFKKISQCLHSDIFMEDFLVNKFWEMTLMEHEFPNVNSRGESEEHFMLPSLM